MRHATTMLKLAAVAALLAAPMFAQSSAYVRVNIPYAFHVGHEVLPAGEYALKTSPSSLLVIQNLNTNRSTLAMAPQTPVAGWQAGATEVRFRAYGNTRFLSSIWIPGTTAIRLVVSPAEREFARSSGSGEVIVATLHAR